MNILPPPSDHRVSTVLLAAEATVPSEARRAQFPLKPLDLFVLVNVVLFICMCGFTYYDRFNKYRGAGHVGEFFVYASVILLAILWLWVSFRRYNFTARLLGLVEVGILAHFAGAFIQWDGYRLYDCFLLGIRYDKYVHFTNAFLMALLLRQLFILRGLRLDPVNRLLILLTVLGLGTVVEIVEYVVCLTIPGNGVGGYDNNMQDLIGNLVGGAVCVAAFSAAPGQTKTARPAATANRLLSAVELVVILAGGLAACWWVMPQIANPQIASFAYLLLAASFAYVVYFSPVRLHRNSLAERGLGTWRTLFVRTDNLDVAARRFGVAALVGTVLILIAAAVWNPEVFTRFNWKAFASRCVVYSMSALIQSLVFVGFLLPRFRDVCTHGDETRRRWKVAALAALVFSVAHAPNLPIIALGIPFAFIVSWISWRTPNVFAAAGFHAVLGVLVHRVLELSMRTGPFYSNPDTYMWRTLFPFVREVIDGQY